jgi:hypothetical protein
MASDLTPEVADQTAQKFRTFFQTLDDGERQLLVTMLSEQLDRDDVSGYLLPAQSFGFELPPLFTPSQGPSPGGKAYPPMPLPMRPGT